jgi:iron complex outermembrane recepter protein
MLQDNSGNIRVRMAVQLAITGSTLAASCGVANAQTAQLASTGTVEEVVVTGSRIAVPNQISISPVTAVSALQIQESGAARIEDLLNELPQVFADQGSSISNGADGTASVNLRGLNSKRTLVLVNGRRLGPGDPRIGASDLNEIPAEIIDSIEVLTGGASSVYGADAVAGVVNFKLIDHFEGVKLVANAGIYDHKNGNEQGVQDTLTNFNATNGTNFAPAPSHVNTGATKEVAFIAGLNTSDGNGNATVYATYRNVAAVLQSKYSYSACTLASGFLAGSYASGGKFTCSGSSTSYPGRFLDLNTGTSSSIGAGNMLVPFSNAFRYNYGPLNFYQRPDERYTAGSFMHYEFNEHATVYAETQYMNDRSIAQIAPSGAFFGGAQYAVNCNSPFLSASMVASWCGGVAGPQLSDPLLIGRRNVEGGPRQDDLEHTSFRVVVGTRGKINDGWDYDASYQYSIVQLAETYFNDVSSSRINNALDVITVGGTPTCASNINGTVPPGLAILGTCVPWNIFQKGGVTPAAAAYISAPGLQRGEVNQTIVGANVTGDLGRYGVQLPTAKSGLKINFGAEWLDIKSSTEPDAEFQTGDLAGQGGPILPVSGGIVSREAFAEARMPLVENMTGVQDLSLEAGYRYSDYSLGFKTNTYKLGLEWSPVEDIRLRGSFARAVRAPNIGELFSPQSVNLDGNTDPCAGPAPTFSAAQCARTGVTAAQYGNLIANSAAQYNGLTGGNPNLQPETALTTSFGIGWTPSFVRNLRVQVDYFDIKIENVIQTIGADTILKQCLQSNLLCNDIHRDAIGSLWLSPTGFVSDLTSNVGQLEEKGIDVDVSHRLDVGAWGSVRTNLNGTYIGQYEVTPIAALSSTSYNCAGYYGVICSSALASAGAPVFHWRHTLRWTWSTPWSGLDLSLAWRYFQSVKLEQLSPNTNLAAPPGATIANGGISNTDATLGSRSYIDLTGAIKLSSNVTVRLGVNNVLDKDPPVFGTTNLPGTSGNGNTFPQVYDSLGRFLFGTITAQF